MKHRLMQFGVATLLVCASGMAMATSPSPSPTATFDLFDCDDSGLTKLPGGGYSGSGYCSVRVTDSSGHSASGSAQLSFNGWRASISGLASGTLSSFSPVTDTDSFVEDGVLWSCSATAVPAISGGASISGSCTGTQGGVAGVASAASAQQQVQATVVQQVSAISSVIASRMLPVIGGGPGSPLKQAFSGTGLAAGGAAEKMNAWASLAQNDSRYSPSDTSLKRVMAVNNAVVGADYQISPSMILGISAAFDRGSGSVTGAATGVSTSGYAFAPYLGVQLGSNMALDFSFGIGKGEASQAGGMKAESNRQFYAANLGYAQWLGNLQLSGKAGYLISQEKYGNSTTNGVTNANTSTNNEVEQMNLSVEAGYWMNGMMPYLGLAYTQDTRMKTAVTDTNWDKDALVLKAGINFFSIANKVTGGIVYSEESGRRNAKNATWMGNINFRF